MGDMTESISASLLLSSLSTVMMYLTSSRSSIFLFSFMVVSLMYSMNEYRSSRPWECRFLAYCAFQAAASALREYFKDWVSMDRQPMLCTGAILAISCSMDMYFLSSASKASMLGRPLMNSWYSCCMSRFHKKS